MHEDSATKVAVLIPAAGRSLRMGSQNKLTLEVPGASTLIEHVVSRVMSIADEVVVVLGHEADVVRSLPGLRSSVVVDNPDWSAGMSTSIAVGTAACSESAQGIMIWPADMPLIQEETAHRLIAALVSSAEPGIFIPTFRGRRGHPVLFAAEFRQDLMELSGEGADRPPGDAGCCSDAGVPTADEGARRVLRAHPEDIFEVVVNDPGIVFDVDTMVDYERFRTGQWNWR